MTPCYNRFFVIALYLVHVAVLSSAIYVPSTTTVKPLERRESVLPWHSVDNENESRTRPESRSSKWQLAGDSAPSKSNTKSWSHWRKAPGSQIEQRTQIDTQDYVPERVPEQVPGRVPEQIPSEQIFEQVPEQQHDFEPDRVKQHENPKRPLERVGSAGSDKDRAGPKNESRYGNRLPQNTIDFESKHPPKIEDNNPETQYIVFEDEDLYEGVPIDSTKPRKQNILLSRRPQQKVARYEPRFGVQCPDHNSTGQFVYPLDCKFFVNCWKGRAFVQPCAPGTHFNPDTLECDFPHKVNCYEERADLREPLHSESQVDRKSQKLQEPTCPPYMTGLLPHHGDCTKFVQCANGATYIMNCGPGTVFNPAVGVCDWPRNVKGCENTFKPDKDDNIPLTPPNPDLRRQDKSEYTEVKRITCPADFTGLLAHPETCKKFLQCANGGTFVMDCGPGTAFNPVTLVCDWPYNVPGCKTDKSSDGVHKISGWSSSGRVGDTATRSNSNRYNHTFDSRGHRPGYGTATSPTFRPTWRPTLPTTTPSPRWIPTRTTALPSYGPGYPINYRDRYGRVNEEGRYGDHGPYRSEWESSAGDPRYRPSDYEFHGRPLDGQWVESQRTDQDSQGSHRVDRPPDGSWLREYERPDRQHDHDGHYPPGYHYHHHHHHYHNYRPTSNPSTNTNWDSSNFTTSIHDQRHDRRYYDGYAPSAGDSHWRPDQDRRQDSRHDYRPPEYAAPSEETDQRQFQPSYFPPGRHDEDRIASYGARNETQLGADGNLPANRRTGYDFVLNRRNDSRTNVRFHRPDFNRTSSSIAGNVFLDSDDKFSQSWNLTQDGSRRDTPPVLQPEQGNTTWNQPGNGSGFKPVTWPGRQNQGQTNTQTNPWDQGTITQEDKLHQWQSGSDIYQQSTIDREADAKLAQWASRAKLFPNLKSQVGLESKNTTQYPTANLYPNGIYVSANGIKGHYITKEIENNQERSKIDHTRDAQKPIIWSTTTFNSTNSDYAPFFNVAATTTTTTTMATTQKIPDVRSKLPKKGKVLRSSRNRSEPNLPGVSIEEDEYWIGSDTKISNVDLEFPDVVEPEIADYDVDVLDDKNMWKPRLVFENKTETTTAAPSVIMRIGPKSTDVELFNIEAAPFQEEEPSFPVYYVQPVQSLAQSLKSTRLPPMSGQIIRLRGGSGPNAGYVEVQGAMPGWGIVCDSRNNWTLKEAHVLCRQLGYIRGAEMAWQGRNNRNRVPTWIAANTVTCLGNETRFQSCKFTHNQECRVDRDAIGVQCALNRVAHCRTDETPHNGQCYHLADPDSGLNHAEALEHCALRNSRLVDITSQAENNFVSEWLSQSYPEVSSIMTSGFGFIVMNRTLWLWEDSARAKFKFTKWWPGWMNDTKRPPWVGSRPLCIIMKREFPCHERPESTCATDYFFWDVEDCATTSKGHSFICERPYDDIGCVYGKGNQYTGRANITVSGNACLSWDDERVAHQLRVNVVNKEIRDKLRTHNFCRNPNPGKESRLWCFAAPLGKREYCDVPACGNVDPKRSMLTGQCKPRHFECSPGECIPSPWVCDGEEDCTNGADEKTCMMDLSLFAKSAKHKLEGYDVEKWLNTPLKACALRCKEADFTCRSFNHKAEGNVCLLSDSNVGLTGALKPERQFDYYEMRERSMNCDGMYVCNNRKCIDQMLVCNGKNDCNDRSDESICTAENLDYHIRLAGSNNSYEGRIEVKVLGYWGQVCDDGFGMINADVICKELGFVLGALEVRPGGFYGNLDPPTRFMVDQLKCRGNETTLRECDFNGWGVHNCQPEEAVGIVCKTAVNTCQEGHWKCDNSPDCIPTPFICDEVVDCTDGSDESPEHCDAPFEVRLANGSSPMQGRVEVRHHGVWGTVCDDDFTNATATVICRSLGYGGVAIAKKDGFFGPGEGPIWLDEVFCHGNETQLYRCEHNHWGQHNCDHNEDAGVICSPGSVNDAKHWDKAIEPPEQNIDELLPANCGRRAKDFNDDEDLIFAKVVHGSVAPKGTYPWQASIRVRGHSRSSHWCGAVVISPLHVLTAAHCLEGYNKGTYFVRAGDYNTDIDEGTEAEANIEDYYVHEDFRKGHRMNNDIALVLLKGHGIPLGKDIMPICLPSENAEYSAGLNCTISGFGSIETGKTAHSKDLRYGWVPLLDQSICRAGYVYGEGAISDGMMCAGYLDEGIDTCDGDSGGPLACYHNGAFTLYGITSWGQHCGRANKPGVYVRVAHYRQWIDKKIRESLAGR